MFIFYCILLVVILFLIFMEIITWPNNYLPLTAYNTYAHGIHVIAYVALFISVCLLLYNELYTVM